MFEHSSKVTEMTEVGSLKSHRNGQKAESRGVCAHSPDTPGCVFGPWHEGAPGLGSDGYHRPNTGRRECAPHSYTRLWHRSLRAHAHTLCIVMQCISFLSLEPFCISTNIYTRLSKYWPITGRVGQPFTMSWGTLYMGKGGPSVGPK